MSPLLTMEFGVIIFCFQDEAPQNLQGALKYIMNLWSQHHSLS